MIAGKWNSPFVRKTLNSRSTQKPASEIWPQQITSFTVICNKTSKDCTHKKDKNANEHKFVWTSGLV